MKRNLTGIILNREEAASYSQNELLRQGRRIGRPLFHGYPSVRPPKIEAEEINRGSWARFPANRKNILAAQKFNAVEASYDQGYKQKINERFERELRRIRR